jgi:hypothetical protein
MVLSESRIVVDYDSIMTGIIGRSQRLFNDGLFDFAQWSTAPLTKVKSTVDH